MVVPIINITVINIGHLFILSSTGKGISYQAVHIFRICENRKIIEQKLIRNSFISDTS